MATSGDLERYVEIDGVRYSHIIDPRTGWGLTQRLLVTVVARICWEADALASAVSVLGMEEGLALVEARDGVEARVVRLSAGDPVVSRTSGFPCEVSSGTTNSELIPQGETFR